jgi:hypothetical protein
MATSPLPCCATVLVPTIEPDPLLPHDALSILHAVSNTPAHPSLNPRSHHQLRVSDGFRPVSRKVDSDHDVACFGRIFGL